MKPHTSKTIAILSLLSLTSILSALALPIDYNEVSLLVRARENESSIIQEVSQRKLLHALTPQQEASLKAQGATDSLVRSLRNSNFVLSQTEAAAFAERQQIAKAQSARRGSAPGTPGEAPSEHIHIFDVSYGHPVNLSKWGGPSYEFAFNTHRLAGEDIIEPVLLDTARSFVDTATYLGAGRPDDSTTVFDRRNYASVMSYSSARLCSIDMKNPVSVKGVPYLLYPIYGAHGVSLYYIGKSADSVKLAVGTWN
jgi:hypothetical protein